MAAASRVEPVPVADSAGEASSAASLPVAAGLVDAGRAQALSIALLDGAAHLRRMSTLSVAAIAAALERILAGEAEAGQQALAATEAALDAASARFARLVALSGAAEAERRAEHEPAEEAGGGSAD